MNFARPHLLSGLAIAILSVSSTSHGWEFESDNGELTGTLDTTLSYGAMWRMEKQDLKLYKGESKPGHDDVNTNDGNRSFDKGLVSQVFRITADLELVFQDNYGLFLRGSAFYDTVLMDKSSHWRSAESASIASGFPAQLETYPYGNSWADNVLDGQGRDAEIKDAYVFGSWDLGEMPVDVRLGRQVINWGEGLFYRDGINTINALDGANFALPGSEVKDLLIPQNAISMNIGLTENLSMAAYYQFEWEETVLPGRGTYFSNNDLFADGSTYGYNEIPESLAQLDQGAQALAGFSLFDAVGLNTHSDYLVVADTSGKKSASDDGQWGFSFKYLAEEMNDTEFGVYFVNYNSHTPYIEAQVNDGAAGRALAAATGAGTPYQAGLAAFYQGVAMQQLAAAGIPIGDPTTDPVYAAQVGAVANQVAGGVAGAYVLSNEVNAWRVYPEDIQMMGISLNTAVGNTSIAAELAYRPNAPIWIDHADDLIDGMNQNMAAILGGADCFSNFSQAEPSKTYCLSSGPYKNYQEVRLWTGSVVFIHNFGPRFGFDGLFGVVEPAFEYIDDLNQHDLYVSSASGPYGESFVDDYTPASDRLDQFSWGFTALASAEINDVFAGVNLNPVISYKQDVSGNSRLIGNFMEGRQALTVALNGVYLNTFEGGISYTAFFGAERTDKNTDRDNLSLNVKYSF